MLIVKAPLAIRPSSWKKAREQHAKRRAKINREYDAALKAAGADTAFASVMSFLAMPSAIMDVQLASLPIKATAGVNRALIDSGIRVPLLGLLPGFVPPEEAEMDSASLSDKKRGELGTKDAVKVALMSLFFAHHNRKGSVISEQKEDLILVENVDQKSLHQYLVDVGLIEKFNNDLRDLMSAAEESIEEFLKIENPEAKIKGVVSLIAAEKPEDFVKAGAAIQDSDLRQAFDKYTKELKKGAEKVANDQKFQKSFLKNLKEEKIDVDKIKKESLAVVFSETHPEFSESMRESLKEYTTFIITSIESIYPPEEDLVSGAMKNKILSEAYDKKNKIVASILSNIQS